MCAFPKNRERTAPFDKPLIRCNVNALVGEGGAGALAMTTIESLREQLAAEAKAFLNPGPRMVDEIECVLSVALAIVLGHLVGAQNISWAAFSGYMVMRGHVSESFRRGVLRILGTGAGAALAVAIFPLVAIHPLALSAALAVIGGCTLYGALTHRHAYGFLFIGLTFSMVLLGYPRSWSDLLGFASSRILEVFAGTTACVLVSMVSTLTLRQKWPADLRPSPVFDTWHADAARHSAQGALAMALLPLVHELWRLPELAQAAVSIMAVMMVPVNRLSGSGLWPVSRKIALRVLGCSIGAALAAAILLIAQGSAAVLIAGSLIGVMIGRHIENGPTAVAYSGTQFTLAMLVALVPDSYIAPDPDAAIARLAGIVIGIALLEPVLAAFHVFNWKGAVAAKDEAT
jgi:uncharacterized membrane protein YccC